MQTTLQELAEMHGRIENDPWVHTREVRNNQMLEAKICKNELQFRRNLSFYGKTNSSSQIDRFLEMQAKECDLLRNMQQKETESQIHKNNEQLENIIGKYVEKEKNDSMHKDRYSQFLRENDPGLRILASQLREAYVSKIRLAQIDEKEKLKAHIEASDLPFVRQMERALIAQQEQEKLDMILEEEKKYRFRKQLEQQMKDKAYFDSINDTREADKDRINAIIKDNLEKVKEEQLREKEKKLFLKNSYMEAFRAKEEYLLKEKERLLAEEEKLKAIRKSSDSRDESKKQLKMLRDQNLAKIQAQLGELLSKKQRDIEEFEAARQDVAIAQAEMQAFRHEKTEQENKEKAKKAYIEELNKHKEFSKAAEQEVKKKERDLEMEIERLNKLKDEKLRLEDLKKQQLKEKFISECQANIKEKALEKERCLEDEIKQEKLFVDDYAKYSEDVAKERVAMIKEMAPHLYPGCIPRGMLKEEDIQYLDDPLKNFLLNKKPYPDMSIN